MGQISQPNGSGIVGACQVELGGGAADGGYGLFGGRGCGDEGGHFAHHGQDKTLVALR